MTFVFPALLGGLLLAGVPILLHLIMRQKPKTLVFPAFRFLVQRQRTNLRKLQLRHLLLLALRMLLVMLVCLALGRPRLFNEGLGLNSERPVAAVLVFDTSLSMEYQTSDKLSRLAEAKKRGQEFLNQLPAGSRVVILDTADPVGSSRGDWLVSLSQAQSRIKGLVPRPASVSALQTLEYAYRILGELARSKEDETSRYLPRFLCVFSDRTRACWELGKLAAAQTAADQVPPSLEGLRQLSGNLAPLIALLKELRAQLPPRSGRDYPEQALIDSLEQLASLLPALTKADFPPDEKLSALAENIQRRGRDLLELLQPTGEQSANKNPEEFRTKLVKNLQAALVGVRGAQGLFVDVGIDQPVDVAITRLELPNQANGQPQQVFGANDTIRLEATVQATGKDVDITLTCKLDNRIYHKRAVVIKAGDRQTVHFEINSAKDKLLPGPHQVEVHFDVPDLLPFNNRRFATFAIQEPRRVLVVTENERRAKKFVETLQLKTMKLGFVVDIQPPSQLPKINPQTYQAVYLFEVAAPEPALWNSLLEFVQQGIGLGIVPGGKETKPENYNDKAAQAVMPGRLERIVEYCKDDGKSMGAIWNFADESIFQHTFMSPFRGWKDYDVVKNPSEAFSFWAVQPHEKEALVVVSYKDLDKDQKDGKLPALVERTITSKEKPAKILLFTTPLDVRFPRWNNYLESKSSMYVVLVGLATNYLAGDTEAPKLNFITGQEEPVVALPPVARFAAYTLKHPTILLPQIPAPERQSQLKLRQAEAPGNYVLEPGTAEKSSDKPLAAFSVNVPAEESDLTRVPVGEIESLLGPAAVTPADRKANIRELLKDHWSEPVDLFPLLMVILLMALAVENLLANKFYRRDNNLNEERFKA